MRYIIRMRAGYVDVHLEAPSLKNDVLLEKKGGDKGRKRRIKSNEGKN